MEKAEEKDMGVEDEMKTNTAHIRLVITIKFKVVMFQTKNK